MSKVEVNDRGIKNRLKSVKPFNAIAEYVWNGFDANATEVCIDYKTDDFDNITELSISDNGNGIPYASLEAKFKPVLSSEKRDYDTQKMLTHGKNGLGRLTFHRFCQSAIWQTTFSKDEKAHQYSIEVNHDKLDHYEKSQLDDSDKKNTGTVVSFKGIFNLSEHDLQTNILSFLVKEFSWFLELKQDFNSQLVKSLN